MVEITESPLDHAALTDRVRHNNAGAVCTFLGTVREMTGDRQTVVLDYEAYPEMAIAVLSEIASEANEKRMPPKRIRKFTLATGCRLLEQFHERQQIVREMTGGLTSHDKARMAVAAMRAQCERRSEARAA